MSKKASKKGKTKQAVRTEDPEPWIEELKSLFINDDHWQCNVTLLMDTNSLNMCCISSFNDMFITGRNVRPHIRVISNLSLAINTLENNYNFANRKDASVSSYMKLCNESLKYCATDGFTLDTPAQILACLIKYHLFELKNKACAEALLLQEYEQKKKKIQDESLTQLENFVKHMPSSKKDKVKSSPKKGTKSGTKSSLDKVTKLRKRNEEFFDHKDVHDQGPDGTQLYVILTGFRQPDLPSELLKLQIPLLAIIKMHDFVDKTGALISKKHNSLLVSSLSSVSRQTKVKQRRYSNAQEEFYLYEQSLYEFWDRLQLILYKKDSVFLFKDTMFIQFYPNFTPADKVKDLQFRPEMLNQTIGFELQESIYEQICFLQYDIQDLKRQHKNYIDGLKIQDVEEKNTFSVNDMQFYLSIMDSVPSEIINVPLILNAILLQVEFSADGDPSVTAKSSDITENDKSSSKQDVEKESKLCSHLKILDREFDLFNHEKVFPDESVHEPIVLVKGDDIGMKTYSWEQKHSVKEITYKILLCFWNNIFRRHLLFYDDILNSEEDNDSDLFEFLKGTGDLTFLKKLSNLPCNHHKILFEDKVHAFCSDSCGEDLTEKPSMFRRKTQIGTCRKSFKKYHHYSDPSEGHFMGQTYDDHGYCFEEITSDILLQNLFQCFESFNCVDVQQDYFQDKFFLKFHNRKTCFEKEYFIGTLRTPTALRDFYDFTIEEEFHWLNEKELDYIESISKAESSMLNRELKQLQRLEYKENLRAQQICSNSNFFSHDSIKSKTQPDRFSLSSQASEKSFKVIEENSVNRYLEAFDIDLPNRVQFSERRQQIMLSSHSKLLIKKLSRLYVNDSIFLQISIFGHTLYFFGPIVKSRDIYFHLLHEKGLVFYFKKNINNLEQPHDYGMNRKSKDYRKSREKRFFDDAIGVKKDVKPLGEIFNHVKYHLSLSLPNSLYLEVVDTPQIPLYVKQYYLSKILQSPDMKNEEFRCCLLDGKLVKFMNDGSAIIYYPNGTIYYCKKMSFESTIVEEVLTAVNKLSAEEQTSNGQKTSGKLKTPVAGKRGKIIISDNVNAEVPKPKHNLKNNFVTFVDSYECTLTTGQRISVDGEKRIELESLFCKSYTDISKGVNITERYDGTTLVHNFEGKLIVNFPDGTRITTFPKFAKDEILIDVSENTERNSKDGCETNKNTILDDNLSGKDLSNKNVTLSEGFVLIEVHHLIEHPNFASISVDRSIQNLVIDLPSNVHISISSEGLYKMNFDQKAELLVQDDELVFREKSRQCLPEFTIYLDNFCEECSENHNFYRVPPESSGENYCMILSCMDYLGNILEVDSIGDVHLEGSTSISNFCKCTRINKDRYFIVNNQLNGLEVLAPSTLDTWIKEAKNSKDYVFHHYASTDHHALLLLKPLMQNECEKWLKEFQTVKLFPRLTLPSTYNDKDSWFNPFPKKNVINKVKIPKAFSVSFINRVNCNIHLEKQSFLKNKGEGDNLRINKFADICVKLYEQGSVKFCKANKTFIDYSHVNIIGRILSRVRKRVIKRLEQRKTKEYELILQKHILLPYFESSQGAVHEIILKIIDSVVEGCLEVEEGSKFERLLKLPLDRLTDGDLDFIHDKISEFTVGSFCSCTKDRLACKLRILLLAGRTLHNLFSDMISVFFLYAENMRCRKLADDEIRTRESTLLKQLLMRPLHLLTENDFQIVHDRLKTLPLCSCSESSKKCKLKVLLLASAVLNDYFPNLDSVLNSSAFNVIV